MKELQKTLTRRINKPGHFLDFYERAFAPYRDKPVTLLEIGVQYGGSLELWRKWFTQAEIIGLDIEPVEPVAGTRIIRGDQTDAEILSRLPDLDIVIDDAGHTMHQQQTTFEALFPKLRSGGLYVIEDLETSYQEEYQDAPETTVDWLKGFLDLVNKGQDVASLTFIKDLALLQKI